MDRKNAAQALSSLREQQKSINTIFIDWSPSLKSTYGSTIEARDYGRSLSNEDRPKKGNYLATTTLGDAGRRHPSRNRRVRSRSLSANGTRQKRNRNAGQSLCSVRPPALARPPVPGNDNHYRGMIAASGPPARQPRYWGMETTL